ncbi:MAG TPA: hypothetical protein VGG10_07455 [Rhizomicrobium sp.]|jgi:hypothetical protein
MKNIVIALGLTFAIVPAFAADPATPPDIAQMKAVLVGTWQRNDDGRFTRELDGNGTETDRYDGDDSATIQGTWALVKGDALAPDRKGHKAPADAVFLMLSQNGDAALFGITALNPQSLTLLNLAGGNSIGFSRLK